MQRFHRALSYLIFSLNGLLVFFWFFKDKLVIPVWMQPLGRMHPLLLHLPIGLFIMTIIMLMVQNQFKRKSFHKTYQFAIALTALFTVITALMGIMLSREGGYDDETLSSHLNLGVMLSLITGFLVGMARKKTFSFAFYGLNSIGFIILVLTGHQGATLTHGENYLLAPLNRGKAVESKRDTLTAFGKAIVPVLEKKCTSCHNSKKRKGELILTDEANILKGGENGLVIIPGNAFESEVLKRIHLDMDHDDHMPPSGKPQLTKNEIRFLEMWIARGADFKKSWTDYEEKDSLKMLASLVLKAYEKPKAVQYSFDFVSPDKLKELNNPFRTVAQLSTDVPALRADFYLAQYFKPESLKDLSDIKSQLVELNLAGMPIEDKDMGNLSSFKNLEVLNVNNTKLTSAVVDELSSLPKLRKLSIAGTIIGPPALEKLSKSNTLQEVYVWNTPATAKDVDNLKAKFPHVNWNLGYIPDEKEKLKLTPPILQNENFLINTSDPIALKHNLPGAIIRYTVDGSQPDSINGIVYSEPIRLKNHSTIKTIATKEGWLKSDELEYRFFIKGIKPAQTKLLTTTSKDYKAKGASTLTDGQIGDADNFRDGNWLGFRENGFEALFYFEKPTPLSEIAFLYDKNIGSYLMPPQQIEIWGGESESNLKLIKKLIPIQPTKYEPNKVGAEFIQATGNYTVIKIIAAPVAKLPVWHFGKGEKGWLMVSEVIFH
jgi:uncharacterized membrane protein